MKRDPLVVPVVNFFMNLFIINTDTRMDTPDLYKLRKGLYKNNILNNSWTLSSNIYAVLYAL